MIFLATTVAVFLLLFIQTGGLSAPWLDIDVMGQLRVRTRTIELALKKASVVSNTRIGRQKSYAIDLGGSKGIVI